jgi:hypothetical protein
MKRKGIPMDKVYTVTYSDTMCCSSKKQAVKKFLSVLKEHSEYVEKFGKITVRSL